ncbi:hypothetical protein SAMN05421890_3948 [Ensifer adhaerens]|nr:hypothetical protein SAMN05421890_3948 [Ensifer adhaerens]
MIAAIGGVYIGGIIFGGKVKDIETALQVANNEIKRHLNQTSNGIVELENRLGGFGQKFSELEEQISAAAESLGQLRGSVGDLQKSTTETDEAPAIENTREQIRDNWNAIRDQLEQKAASPHIDGRTRAKYARIDRRSYSDLIEQLNRDGNLPEAASYHLANQLWQKYRTGRRAIDQVEANQLREIRNKLVGVGVVIN